MRIIFQFSIDDPQSGKTRRFFREDDVRYPGVPRIGEAAFIPAADPNSNLGTRRIGDIIYRPNGAVVLDFELDGLINDARQQIEAMVRAGFMEGTD